MTRRCCWAASTTAPPSWWAQYRCFDEIRRRCGDGASACCNASNGPRSSARGCASIPRRDHAGAVAAGAGSRAPVPEDPQQVAQRGGVACWKGAMLRPRGATWRSCAPLRSLPDHPPAGRRRRWRRLPRLRVPQLGAVGVRRRAVPRHEGQGAHQFRVTRNSEADRRRDDVDNLSRWPCATNCWAAATCCARCGWRIDERCPPTWCVAAGQFRAAGNAVYKINGPVSLNRRGQVYDLVTGPTSSSARSSRGCPQDMDGHVRRDPAGRRAAAPSLRRLHPVLELIRQAAEDPSDVLAIKADPVPHRAGTRRSSNT